MNPKKNILLAGYLVCYILLPSLDAIAQQQTFTHRDSLRGTITPQRAWWDVTFYDLNVHIHPQDSSIAGYNTIYYKVTKPSRNMQIDLMTPLQVDSIFQSGQRLSYHRDGNAFFVDMPYLQKPDEQHQISIYYHGNPRIAKNPPWEGGFIWTTDSLDNHWVSTANQGVGASIWWPNKDHQSDEPDSASINITVPSSMVDVSNGRLRSKTNNEDGTITYNWFVSNPINNYTISVNAGNYVHFGEEYQGLKGQLDLDYWVLRQDLDKARKQFRQVKPMLKCFEHWFGPYPFYEDSYKLVEAPYLGMEHQSAVTYGNGFHNSYHGIDLSGTGWGMKFDFIIVHESSHEWWGNNITSKDIADMWVHEGFTNYAENLYVECQFGKKAGAEYVRGTRSRILNDKPVIGPYGVNKEGSGDMYYKAGNMLHMIRQIINDDTKWRFILRGLQRTFYHKVVTTDQVESYINQHSKADLSKIFDQYLRHTEIPTLQYYITGHKLYYKWDAVVKGFNMPIKVSLKKGHYSFINPTTREWKSIEVYLDKAEDFKVDINFYIQKKQLDHKPDIKNS